MPKTELPAIIKAHFTEPHVVQVDNKPVEVRRHVLKIFLPSGHILDATCSSTEYYKLLEIADSYPPLPDTTDALPQRKCPHCATEWQGRGTTCPGCLKELKSTTPK